MDIERTIAIAVMYNNGETYEQIRQEMKCSNRYIIKSLKIHGIERRTTKHCKQSDETLNEEMKHDILSGMYISDMKRKYNISFYTAKKIVERYRQTGMIKHGRSNETKYHAVVRYSEINHDITPTCIYLNGFNGDALQCGRQVV